MADTEAYDRVIVARNSVRQSRYTHRVTIRPGERDGKARHLTLTRDELIALAELATEYVDTILS